jgi:hypothetical protein
MASIRYVYPFSSLMQIPLYRIEQRLFVNKVEPLTILPNLLQSKYPMSHPKKPEAIRPRAFGSLFLTFCKEFLSPARNGLPFSLPPEDIVHWFRENRFWGRRPDPVPPPFPWLNYNLLRWIERLGPRTVFEWGSGASTIWFSRLPTSPKVVSVESDPKWHSAVEASLSVHRFQTKLYLRQEKADYLEAFRSSGILPPDLILIDGLWRDECLLEALPCIAKSSSIIFHDSHAQRHRKCFANLPSSILKTEHYGPCHGIKNFRGWTLLQAR